MVVVIAMTTIALGCDNGDAYLCHVLAGALPCDARLSQHGGLVAAD